MLKGVNKGKIKIDNRNRRAVEEIFHQTIHEATHKHVQKLIEAGFLNPIYDNNVNWSEKIATTIQRQAIFNIIEVLEQKLKILRLDPQSRKFLSDNISTLYEIIKMDLEPRITGCNKALINEFRASKDKEELHLLIAADLLIKNQQTGIYEIKNSYGLPEELRTPVNLLKKFQANTTAQENSSSQTFPNNTKDTKSQGKINLPVTSNYTCSQDLSSPQKVDKTTGRIWHPIKNLDTTPVVIKLLPNGDRVLCDLGPESGVFIYRKDGSLQYLYDERGEKLAQQRPTCLTVDKQGNIYIAVTEYKQKGKSNSSIAKIIKYDSQGKLLSDSYPILIRDQKTNVVIDIYGMAVWQGKLYYTISTFGELRILDLVTSEEEVIKLKDSISSKDAKYLNVSKLSLDEEKEVLYLGSVFKGQGLQFNLKTKTINLFSYQNNNKEFFHSVVINSNLRIMYMINTFDNSLYVVHMDKGFIGLIELNKTLNLNSLETSNDEILVCSRGGFWEISNASLERELTPAENLPAKTTKSPGITFHQVDSMESSSVPVKIEILPNGDKVIGDTAWESSIIIYRNDGSQQLLTDENGNLLGKKCPKDMAVDEQGNIYVAIEPLQKASQIYKYNSGGEFLGSYDIKYPDTAVGKTMNIQGMVVWKDKLYYTLMEFCELRILDLTTGKEEIKDLKDLLRVNEGRSFSRSVGFSLDGAFGGWGALFLSLDKAKEILYISNSGEFKQFDIKTGDFIQATEDQHAPLPPIRVEFNHMAVDCKKQIYYLLDSSKDMIYFMDMPNGVKGVLALDKEIAKKARLASLSIGNNSELIIGSEKGFWEISDLGLKKLLEQSSSNQAIEALKQAKQIPAPNISDTRDSYLAAVGKLGQEELVPIKKNINGGIDFSQDSKTSFRKINKPNKNNFYDLNYKLTNICNIKDF